MTYASGMFKAAFWDGELVAKNPGSEKTAVRE
jgi:hypothetical protein